MNVSFELNEVVNDWKVIEKIGCSRFIIKKDNIVICFDSNAGMGKNYFNIRWYTDLKNDRQYRAQRFLLKYIPIVRSVSGVLYDRFKEQNDETNLGGKTMNKIEALKALKKRILDDGTGKYRYIEVDNATGECTYCAVGHLMDIYGVDVKKLDGNELNGLIVTRLDNTFLNDVMKAGFTIEELRDLQFLNDDGYVSDLLEYIEDLIKEG